MPARRIETGWVVLTSLPNATRPLVNFQFNEFCRSDCAQMTPGLCTRITPTPSGYLHWGNAFSFVLTWLITRKSLGHVVLRIDDLDTARKRPEYIEDIFQSLDWLGLDYDEGPSGPDDFERKYSQRLRTELYAMVLDELRHRSRLFACQCSRSSIQRTPNRLHPEECQKRGLSLHGEGVAWRITTSPRNVIEWRDVGGQQRSVDLHRDMRDFIVRRKDTVPAYQVASLVDDLHFGINFIVRGEDLLASTAAQVFLAEQIDEYDFCQSKFLHHRLLTDDAGSQRAL